MRGSFSVALALLLLACGPKAQDDEPDFEEFDAPTEAPAGPLVIRRPALNQVLSRGPGAFFERMPVRPSYAGKHGKQFVGYELIDVNAYGPGPRNGVQSGDVVVSVNALPVARPEQFLKVWAALKDARELRVELLRRGDRKVIIYTIIPE